MEEYEDAMNADDDIFAEPVQQNRLKTLSKYSNFQSNFKFIKQLTFFSTVEDQTEGKNDSH